MSNSLHENLQVLIAGFCVFSHLAGCGARVVFALLLGILDRLEHGGDTGGVELASELFFVWWDRLRK